MGRKKIGRLLIDETKFHDLFFKLNFLNKLRMKITGNKEIKNLEVYILELNSFYQNDLFSGAIFIFNFRKFFSKKKEQIFSPTMQHNTLLLYLFIQKTITGNSFKVTRFLFDYLFTGNARRILILEFLKIYNSYDFLFGFKFRVSGIIPFVISFIKEKNRKRCIALVLNQVFFKYSNKKKIEFYFSFKLKPFITNCSFFFLESLGIKLLFLHHSIIEHFTFNLPFMIMKKTSSQLFISNCLNVKKFIYEYYEFFNCLQILQSIEISSANYQFFYNQMIIKYKKGFFLKKNFHPLLISILEKNKSNFFF